MKFQLILYLLVDTILHAFVHGYYGEKSMGIINKVLLDPVFNEPAVLFDLFPYFPHHGKGLKHIRWILSISPALVDTGKVDSISLRKAVTYFLDLELHSS